MKIEVSVVIPCLNEDKAVGICVEKCFTIFRQKNINGEVIVVDNGSTDKSAEVAAEKGARVFHQPLRGYGYAYLKGFSKAQGKYLIMADSDNTYDLMEIPAFLTNLEQGYEFVIGNRLNEHITPGSMPWMHQHIGNPFLTFLMRIFYGGDTKDVYCGMRGLTKKAYKKLNIQGTGFEFALEMVIKAIKYDLKVINIPITYNIRIGESKLDTFRDGWRSFRFMLLMTPLYLFVIPGSIAISIGLLSLSPFINNHIVIGKLVINQAYLGTLLTIVGYHLMILGLYSKMFAINNGFDVSNKIFDYFLKHISLELGLLVGFIFILISVILGFFLINYWNNPSLHIDLTKIVLLLVTVIIIGVQTIFSSFFISMIGIGKKSNVKI